MSILERGLAKLKIAAWKDREGKIPAGNMSVMFNPDNLQLDYRSRYKTEDTINKATQSNRYIISEPVGLTLKLVFDARMPASRIPVEKQLDLLKSLCAVNTATDSPHFLRVTWGKMRWINKSWFAGRASGLSVSYTLFDRDATPLRAEASLSLVADESFTIQQSEKYLKSPSSGFIRVTDLATLPLLAASGATVLGSDVDPLSMAWNNDLDSLDDYVAGGFLQVDKGGES